MSEAREAYALFEDVSSLEKAAEFYASKANPRHFSEALYLYFIARYLVSVFEVEFRELPIQVWNEYRNALDHFFRYVESGEKNQIAKMNGHIQRAVLDVCKFYCYRAYDQFNDNLQQDIYPWLKSPEIKARLVADIEQAKKLFIEAKNSDVALGSDEPGNRLVIRKYLKVFFRYLDISRSFLDLHKQASAGALDT